MQIKILGKVYSFNLHLVVKEGYISTVKNDILQHSSPREVHFNCKKYDPIWVMWSERCISTVNIPFKPKNFRWKVHFKCKYHSVFCKYYSFVIILS